MARSPRPSRPSKPAAAPSAVAAPARAGLLSADDILRLLEARHDDPFAVLGPHVEPDGRRTVRVFLPGALEVAVTDAAGERTPKRLVRMHPAGVFEGHVPFAGAYRLRVLWEDGTRSVEHDAYGYPPLLGDLDAWLLGEGTHLRPYETLGAMPCVHGETAGTRFAVWAPNASRVSVVGDWNRWDGRRHPMRRRHDAGVWEIFVPGVTDGARYKFEIAAADGRLLPLKADPYGRRAELRPGTASVVSILPPVAPPNDARRAANGLDAPISVYEVHLGSWRHVPEEGDRWLTWDELAEGLVGYAVDMGFTHLELMPISEHPFDGSWGYQPLGLYAPTARFGDPQGFRRFVDAAHAAGIGVLADWVPAHFPADEHGLARFDGTHLYEHADPREGFHPDWNTLIYNFGRSEVRNYLVGNALYWLERFAIDGLRVDAVASMLYRDYSRAAGEWIPNAHGGRESLEAAAFLRRLNEVIGVERPDAVSVAEESTSYPQVSRPVYAGGLGFHYKWNMGWMHDTLVYMARDPVHRRHHHGEISFALVYAWSENFVLPLSHDEVVHGKGSLLERMPGDRWQRFANLRAYYAFMFGHPGKKLLFMGAEIAQEREWTHERSLDWHLLEDPAHAGVQRLVRDLNAVYRRSPALFERDFGPEGFEWIDANDAERSILSFVRHDAAGERPMLVVCNFTPVVHRGLRFGVPRAGRWTERLNTDAAWYGGSDVGTPFGAASSEATASHGRAQSIVIDVPPLATVFFEWQP